MRTKRLLLSLPLDARGGLGADVVEHAVDAFDAVEDGVGDRRCIARLAGALKG
jgi:hypothetical protein